MLSQPVVWLRDSLRSHFEAYLLQGFPLSQGTQGASYGLFVEVFASDP
jgi:hypothetical protein